VRELQSGPLRYGDLLERLGGCSTNMLAARLKDLEAGGVVRKRRLPPPGAATVYELTEDGASLRPVLAALARWGAARLPPAAAPT
jgi:DNA-binding HxlR family transcriptional regulator